MSEIPADVLKLARQAIMAEVKPDVRWQYADGRCDHFAVVQAVAKAIMAERERAAKICEAQKEEFLSEQYASNQPFGSISERFACDECARAIRGES